MMRRARSAAAKAAVTLAIMSTVICSGVAYAVWTSAGSGNGSATMGTTANLTNLTATASTTSKLYPGGPNADVATTVSNPNAFPVKVTGAAFGAVTVSGATGTCVTTGVTFTTPTAGLPTVVPANGSASITLAGAASMGAAAENGCQNATFTVALTLTATN